MVTLEIDTKISLLAGVYRRLTSDPYSLMSLLSDIAVRDVVTVAVKIDMITRPIRTQMNANVRASTDLGARSP